VHGDRRSKPELTEIGAHDVLAKVAEGGMGTVYKRAARGRADRRQIKIIPPGAARTPILMQRFKREVQHAAAPADRPPQRRQGDRILRTPRRARTS